MPENPLIDPYSEVNRFLALAQLGHGPNLLPIVPPGTPVSQWAGPKLREHPEKLGKIPSLLAEDGGAHGLRGWGDLNVSHETLEAWHFNLKGCPYGIGLKLGDFGAFDIDANDETFAQRCFLLLSPFYEKYGGGVRVGRPPAFLFPFRCENPWRKVSLKVRDTITGIEHLAEMLGQGQYANMVGLRKIGQPYRWYRNAANGLLFIESHRDEYEPATDGDVEEAIDRLRDGLLAHYEPVERASAPKHATQAGQGYGDPAAHLAPSIDPVIECLRWLPNDKKRGRSRDEWLSVIRAVATSTGKSAEGLEIACQWSAQWDDSPKAFNDCCAAWDSIEPARSQIGFRWLAAKAGDESKGRCTVGIELDFGGDDDDDPPPPAVPVPADVQMMQPPPPNKADVMGMVERLPEKPKGEDVAPIITALAAAGLSHLDADDVLKEIRARAKLSMKLLTDQLRGERLKLVTGGEFDVPRRLARACHAEFGIGRLAFYMGRYYRYEGRHWLKITENTISGVMHKIAASNVGLMTPPGSGTADSISTATAQGRQQLAAMVENRLAILSDMRLLARKLVNVNNGTLHFEDGQWILKPHNPDDGFLHVCPYDYDPKVSCPLFDATLHDTMSRTYYTLRPTDPEYSAAEAALEIGHLASGELVERGGGRTIKVFDIADNVRMVEETCGYAALVGWRGARQFVIGKGEGSNGKTLLFDVVQGLMSPDMVHNGSIEILQKSDFVVSQLAGKLLSITDDAKDNFELNDSIIKQISENKMMTGQIKGVQEPVQFYSTVLPVILSNSWPVSPDISRGMRARALIIPFGKDYPKIPETATPWYRIRRDPREMTGMLNRLLAGLARVIERGFIKPSRASEEAFQEWISRNALEMQFIEARCTRAQPANQKSDGELVDVLFGEFRHWYTEQGNGQLRGPKLRKRFRDNLTHLGHDIYASGGRNRYRVRGLWLRDDVRNAPMGFIEPEDDSEEDED